MFRLSAAAKNARQCQNVWNMYSCGSVVEHWVSSAKSFGFNSQGKMYSLSKSQASAQCVNVNSQSKCRRRDLRFRRWAARDLRVRAEVRYKQLNMRQFSNICQTFTKKIKSYTSDINFQERKLLLAFSNFSDFNAIYVIRHNVAYITLEISLV